MRLVYLFSKKGLDGIDMKTTFKKLSHVFKVISRADHLSYIRQRVWAFSWM